MCAFNYICNLIQNIYSKTKSIQAMEEAIRNSDDEDIITALIIAFINIPDVAWQRRNNLMLLGQVIPALKNPGILLDIFHDLLETALECIQDGTNSNSCTYIQNIIASTTLSKGSSEKNFKRLEVAILDGRIRGVEFAAESS